MEVVTAEITTCEELQNMKNNLSRNYYLGKDIDCSDTVKWNSGAGFVPVGNYSNKFTGTFDGRGYKITGLFINRPTDYEGLLGCTGSGSEIKDAGLEDVDVTGDSFVGGLVGTNYGTITNSYSTGSVSGVYGYGGGLVGENDGTITNSYSAGSVSGGECYGGGLAGVNVGTINNSYSTGTVTGCLDVGGLVGHNSGTITNSYSTGSVSGNCGNCYVGGLVGYNPGGTITNSYWDIETSGQSSSAGGEGKTTAEMKQQATFVDWDFLNIWDIIEEVTYPYLRWQGLPVSVRIKLTHHYGNLSDYNGVPMFNIVKSVTDGSTPLDVLQSVADITIHEGRVYSINGITESPPNYWYLYINGIPAPDEDVDSYQLRDGEVIHWDYSSMINAGDGEGLQSKTSFDSSKPHEHRYNENQPTDWEIVQIKVVNNGTGDANNFEVEILLDGVPYATTTVSVCAKAYRFVYLPVPKGCNVTVRLDAKNVVNESNETNNEVTKSSI